jgi:hypothetical protein
MARRFNTTGPCIPMEHYMLRPEDRCPGIMDLIEGKQFFVIHAPRQSGKTTLLNSLEQQLNAGNKYHALYCSLESVQGINEASRGISAILNCLEMSLKYHAGLRHAMPDYLRESAENTALRSFLTDLTAGSNRPLVVFFDEADCLGGETLISFLRQLRDGYVNRIRIPFLHSLALVGMRNIRDYRVQVRPDTQTLGSASPFNIAKEAMTLKYFSRDDIAALYQQHTADTGQVFPADLVDEVWEMTLGQPWLVNAIAAEMVEKICRNDATKPLTAAMAEAAAQAIVLRRDTHIDSLLERLKEPRVQRIIEPILLGEGESIERQSSDFQFVRDLGLIRNDNGTLRIANPIYSEVFARTLNYDSQQSMPAELINRWMDGQHLDLTGLLKGFQEFWRDHSESWRERFQYKEAAPHLILLAYLQRVVNGGAKITREFATGTRRVDVCVEYVEHRYPIEMKLMRGPKTREEGLTQLTKYMDTLGCKEGWLLLFDVNSSLPWEQRLTWETVDRDCRTIHVVGA